MQMLVSFTLESQCKRWSVLRWSPDTNVGQVYARVTTQTLFRFSSESLNLYTTIGRFYVGASMQTLVGFTLEPLCKCWTHLCWKHYTMLLGILSKSLCECWSVLHWSLYTNVGLIYAGGTMQTLFWFSSESLHKRWLVLPWCLCANIGQFYVGWVYIRASTRPLVSFTLEAVMV